MRYPSKEIGMSLLMFLWKWKVATTTAIAARFFPGIKTTSVHRRLLELKGGGYVTTLTSHTGYGHVWTLTKKGFEAIRELLPELHKVGFQPESIGQDLITMTAMMGDWLPKLPDGVELYSEQLLKRVHHNQFPMWVPQSDLHFASGYWRLPKLTADHSVALQVERCERGRNYFELVADFYEGYHFVANVIWLVPFSGTTSRIEKGVEEYLKSARTKHLFLPIEEFTKVGWQAKFRSGQYKDQTLSDFLSARAAPPCLQGASLCMLETRKKPFESIPKEITATHSFFN